MQPSAEQRKGDNLFLLIPFETSSACKTSSTCNAGSQLISILLLQGLHAPSPVNHSPNDQIWRDEELARAMQVSSSPCLALHRVPLPGM